MKYVIAMVLYFLVTTNVSATEYENTDVLADVAASAQNFEECFKAVCNGCKSKKISFIRAKQRGERIVISAHIDYSVSGLWTANYSRAWRVELRDDIDRFLCVSADYDS